VDRREECSGALLLTGFLTNGKLAPAERLLYFLCGRQVGAPDRRVPHVSDCCKGFLFISFQEMHVMFEKSYLFAEKIQKY
jgi:hypothetical protein